MSLFSVFNYIKLALFIIVGVIIWRKKSKVFAISYIIISVVILFLIGRFPPENIFNIFESPEEAFEYVYNDNVIISVYGNNTCLVIGENEQDILLLKNNYWKIGNRISNKIITKATDEYYFELFSEPNITDYYVIITLFNDCDAKISDNRNSIFQIINNSDSNIIQFVGYIGNDINNYLIFINNEELHFD